VSKNLRGYGFAKYAQHFIYRGTTSGTGVGDVTRLVDTEDHSSNGRMTSSASGTMIRVYIASF
jgi:hypothetical protein